MTGGIGFASDMLKRYKANRALLKNSKKWGHASSDSNSHHFSVLHSKPKEVNDEPIPHETINQNKPTSSVKNNIQNSLTKIILLIAGIGGFLYLILKYLN